MKTRNKGITLVEWLVTIAIIGIIISAIFSVVHTTRLHACSWWEDCSDQSAKQELAGAATLASNLRDTVPVPKLQTSMERVNVAKRAEIFNKSDKISYIYLVSYGKVMAFYTVKGKVSSLKSYMVPTDRITHPDGSPCSSVSDNCLVTAAPDIDGTYGENVDGVFFFTTEGAYVEWKGDYMMSDQPLRLATQPELVREIK